MASLDPLSASDVTQPLGYPRKLLEAEQVLKSHPNPAVALMVSTTVRMVQRQIKDQRDSDA